MSEIGVVETKDCKCPVDCKVPLMGWYFWVDQNTIRKMVIVKIDQLVTGQLQKLEERKRKAAKLEAEIKTKMGECRAISEDLEIGYSSGDHDTDESYIEETKEDYSDSEYCSTSDPQNRNVYLELCKAIDRANVSNWDACLIANAVLKDLGLLSSDITPQQTTPSKICLEKKIS